MVIGYLWLRVQIPSALQGAVAQLDRAQACRRRSHDRLADNGWKEAVLGEINPKSTSALRSQSAHYAAQMLVAANAAHGADLGMNIIQYITPAGRTLRVIWSARGSNPHRAYKAP